MWRRLVLSVVIRVVTHLREKVKFTAAGNQRWFRDLTEVIQANEIDFSEKRYHSSLRARTPQMLAAWPVRLRLE